MAKSPFLDLQLGIWTARLWSCTPSVDSIPLRIRDTLGHATKLFCPLETPPRLIVVADERIDVLDPPSWLAGTHVDSWVRFRDAWSNAYRHYCEAGDSPRRVSEKRPGDFLFAWPHDIYDSSGEASRYESSLFYQYVGLILRDEAKNTHLHALAQCNYLAAAWHVAQGGLLIHSAAAAKADSGFLFLGDSGAGKTTVSKISNSLGISTLGDDLNFLLPDDNGHVMILAAPSLRIQPFGYESIRPSLRAIFSLVQDTRDDLIPLTPLQTAELLVRACYQTPFVPKLPEPGVRQAFRNACTIARDVPGFELHFTKSPRFWDTIDKRIPS